MIKFTIITCTYNAADVIKPTLDSILNQTWGQIEHLIIDGASKDDTVKVAEAYRQRSLEEETEHDVRIISEPDRGLYDAMNKGLRLATGDYVVFLNAGDSLPNDDTLEKISNDVNERSDGKLPAVLYGDTDIVDERVLCCIRADLLRPTNSTGARSVTACWCATRLSTPAQT